MHANRDDAPTRMRQEARSAYTISVIIMACLGGLGWAAFSFGPSGMGNPVKTEFTHQNTQPALPQRPQTPPQDSAATPYRALPSFERPIRPQAPHELDAQGRQVVFNDQNYRPDPSRVNIIPAVKPSLAKEASRPSSTPPTQRILTHHDRWTWIGADRSTRSGPFSWEEVNGEIDYSTVCQHYSYGSFSYRDCRKGAKVRFAELCKRGRTSACHAQNNYMP